MRVVVMRVVLRMSGGVKSGDVESGGDDEWRYRLVVVGMSGGDESGGDDESGGEDEWW